MVISWNKKNTLALVTDMHVQKRHSPLDTREKVLESTRSVERGHQKWLNLSHMTGGRRKVV